MISNRLIRDIDATKRKIKNISDANTSDIVLLIDFDRTITYAEDPCGNKGSTSHMALSDARCLSHQATNQVIKLYEHYHPVELSNLSEKEKEIEMINWWQMMHDILIREKITRGDISKAISKILIRNGFHRFINLAKDKEIALYIMSAGLQDIIEESLRQLFDNLDGLTIIANKMIFDKTDSHVVGFSDPLIHILNKNILSLPRSVQNKKWFIVIGDSLHDLDMVGNRDRSKVLSIGYANSSDPSLGEALSRSYDIVLNKTSGFEYPCSLLELLKD